MERQYIWHTDFVFYTKMKNFRDKVCVNSQLKQPHFLFRLKIPLDHWFLVYNIWLVADKLNIEKRKFLIFWTYLGHFFFSWYKISLLVRYFRIDSQSLYFVAVALGFKENIQYFSSSTVQVIFFFFFFGSLWIFFNICGIISLCIFWLMAFSTTCWVLKHL